MTRFSSLNNAKLFITNKNHLQGYFYMSQDIGCFKNPKTKTLYLAAANPLIQAVHAYIPIFSHSF